MYFCLAKKVQGEGEGVSMQSDFTVVRQRYSGFNGKVRVDGLQYPSVQCFLGQVKVTGLKNE